MKNRSEQTNRQVQTGHYGNADDYTLYETTQHTSKGDAKMTKMMKALDAVLQDTNAETINDTTLFYWNGKTFTGTQDEVHTALKETTRKHVQAVLTHGDEALYATIDGWYNEQVDQEVLGQIETWEDFKALLPEEYEQDLLEIYTYLHSGEMTSMLNEFYEKPTDEDDDDDEEEFSDLWWQEYDYGSDLL